MANNYKFTGVALAVTDQTAIITAASGENIIIKSIIITNNTANTPTVTLDVTDTSASATYQILRTHALTANTSEELITKPLVLEATDILKATMSSTDSVHIAVSYLVIT
ncbi:hypothetical protein [uncultured Mediterranean phage uvDeep-CGR2-AD10-C281]|jgi:hypothetical protein|nr:hypothetical protein [uncultured Mediterranean phage uvDeep-CGR2-AD10-C281]